MTVLPPSPPASSEKPSGTTAGFPAPTGAQLLRGLKAPTIGYAWLVLGAIAVMVLIVVAANVGSTGDETGVESDDTNALGVLIGMPFQIASMALLGSLHFTEDGARASLFLPPLALTALYVVTTARSARRGEVVPAAGTRALLATIVGLGAAVVLTPLSWVLAMRADGAAVHAASVSLFFGVWSLTAIASYVGTSRAAGITTPTWVPTDYVVAARVWLSSVVLWVGCAVAVLTVVVIVKDGLWVGVLFPVWGPTVGLYSYAVAHFGGLSAAGEGLDIGDFSAAWTIVAMLGALVLNLLTSVAWHLRRDGREATLAQPGSWATLPATYGVGGLLVWLVPSVVLGGGYDEVGASVTLQPAFWLIFVLFVWGAAVELASRFVAPGIAAALPARVIGVLRGGGHTERPPSTQISTASTIDAGATPPRPLTPEERARYRTIGIAVGAVAVVGLGSWIAVSVVNSQHYRPEDQAKTYLDAVVDGDLEQVNTLAPTDDDLGDDSLLIDEIYKAADHRITGYDLGEVERNGDTATVEVRLEGLSGSARATLTLTKDGHTKGVFDSWKVTEGLAKTVSIALPDAAPGTGLTVNGVAVDRPDTDVWLLPGDYDFDAFAGNKWLETDQDASGVTVTAGDDYQFADVPLATASPAFKDEVESQLDDYLSTCMASTRLEPVGCPNAAYAYGDVRNVHWVMDDAPTPDYEYFDGTFPADLSYGDSGHATVTYESDESYGYGRPDWQPQTDDSDLYLDSIIVDVVGDDLVVSLGNQNDT